MKNVSAAGVFFIWSVFNFSVFQLESGLSFLWHQAWWLTNRFLNRNREPGQLWQWRSTYSRDRWLSGGNEQTINKWEACAYTQRNEKKNTFILLFNDVFCATRVKGDPSNLRLKKTFRPSSWSATGLMGKWRFYTSLLPPTNPPFHNPLDGLSLSFS